MRSGSKQSLPQHPERGAVLVLVAISTVVLVGFAALAVDLGYVLVVRNELQNVADGSALAGARALGGIYQGMTYTQQRDYVCAEDCQTIIRSAAQEVADQNRAGGALPTLREQDIQIGRWSQGTFSTTSDKPDAVYVIARRDEMANSPLTTFFARVLGIEEVSVNAEAIAAMTGQGTAWEGEVELPIGISRYFFDSRPDEGYCLEDIRFYPANDPISCAGWTSWEYSPPNDALLRKILQQHPSYPGPGALAGETYFNFIGGTLSNPTFTSLLQLFQVRGWATDIDGEFLTKADGVTRIDWEEALDQPTGIVPLMVRDNRGNLVQAKWPDGNLRYLHRWDTTVPVYDRGDCSNPNRSIRIVGFARVMLTDVFGPPNHVVQAKVLCDLTSPEDNRGGGGEYGLKGPIPGLVR